MNEKHLLINGLTLIYRANTLPHMSDDFEGLVREVVSNIKLPEFSVGQNGEAKVIAALKNTVLSMCGEKTKTKYTAPELLQRVRIDTSDEPDLFDAVERGIAVEMNEDTTKQYCINLANGLQAYQQEKKLLEVLGKAYHKIKFDRDKIPDIQEYATQLYNDLESYQSPIKAEDPAIINSVRIGDLEAMKNIYDMAKVMNLEDGILRTGYQGLNRMYRGGFRRGDEVVIGALQHNYKTGFSLTVFKQLCMYNKPYMINEAKKPLMIRISFEDDLALNMEFLYRNLWENEHGTIPDMAHVDSETISRYVMDRLQATGYHVIMLRVDPTKWTYRDVVNFCLKQEAMGYEIHVLMLDYLKMLPTTGCTTGPTGFDVRDMYRRMRNFCNPRKITLITPHQLSTDAKMMIREGRTDFVQHLPGKGYYDGCKTVDNEVDLETFIHIEKVNGQAYLTIQRGKHRVNGVTPEVDMYCCYPFTKEGGIMDDINGPDNSRRKPGGGQVGSNEEIPFWA